MKSVYISGPYSQPDPSANTLVAMGVWHQLAELNLFPFCPHLTHYLHLFSPRDYDEWMAHDIYWLRKCDYLLRIPGESPGAELEIEIAHEEGIPVFYSLDELQKAVA